MNEAEVLNNELANTIERLIDKFNLTLEVSSEQLKNFSLQMTEKIINWEFVTSLVAIAGWILAILIIVRLHEHFKIGTFKKLNEDYNKLWENTESNRANIDKLMVKYSFKIIAIFLLLLFTSFIVGELKDIILCAVFPEKIIIEFISSYL